MFLVIRKMCHKFIISAILLFWIMNVQAQQVVQPGPPDFCPKTSFHRNDQYHKDAPSPGMGDFPNCSSWKNLSCCTQALSEALSRNMSMGLYNWSYIPCGPISDKCARFMRVSVRVNILQVYIYHIIDCDVKFSSTIIYYTMLWLTNMLHNIIIM